MYEYIISFVIIYISYKIFIRQYYINLISYYNSNLRNLYNKQLFYTDLFTSQERNMFFTSLVYPKKRLIDYIFGYDITNSLIYTLMCHKNTYKNDSCFDKIKDCKNYQEAKEILTNEFGFDPDLLDKIRNYKSIEDENYTDDDYEDNEVMPTFQGPVFQGQSLENINKILSTTLNNFKNIFGQNFNIEELANILENSNETYT